jgi:hypothetical protein
MEFADHALTTIDRKQHMLVLRDRRQPADSVEKVGHRFHSRKVRA